MSTSPDQPNKPQYSTAVLCVDCGLTRPVKYMVKGGGALGPDSIVYACRDVDECISFKETGHGLRPWPTRKSAKQLLDEAPEPQTDDEFWNGL